jgi:hypothetical protein
VAACDFREPFPDGTSDFLNPFKPIKVELKNIGPAASGKVRQISKHCLRSAKKKFNYFQGENYVNLNYKNRKLTHRKYRFKELFSN